MRREGGGGGAVLEVAKIVSDAANSENLVVQLSNGQEESVARSMIEFGPHIVNMVVKDYRYQVQLLTPRPDMRGARVELHGDTDKGRHGRIIQSNTDGDVGTLKVMFGCETGEYPRPRLLCACNLRMNDSCGQVL